MWGSKFYRECWNVEQSYTFSVFEIQGKSYYHRFSVFVFPSRGERRKIKTPCFLSIIAQPQYMPVFASAHRWKKLLLHFHWKQNIGSGSDSMRYSRSSRLCMLVCKGQVTSKSVGLCFKWTDICSRAGGGHHPSNTMASKCVGVTRYPSDVSAIHPCTSLLSAKYKVSEQNFRVWVWMFFW